MRKIHPFDVYVQSKDIGRYFKDTMERIDIPVFDTSGNFIYNSQGSVVELNGEIVLVTTTVKPITTEIV